MHCSNCFIYINPFHPHTNPVSKYYYHPHFKYEKLRSRKKKLIYPDSTTSKYGAGWESMKWHLKNSDVCCSI